MMASKDQNKRKKNLDRLQEVHSAMGCYIYMVISIAFFVVIVCAGLFLAERLFPRSVHVFNYSLSTRTFVELKSAHKYKAAADFYEQKKEIFTTHGDKYINMIEVFDCYRRIGEYEKAEQILRDIQDYKYLSEKEKREFDKEPWLKDFFCFNVAKEFFNLYEEMGDIDGQRQSYTIMKESLTPEVKEHFKDLLSQSKKEFKKILPNIHKLENSLVIDEMIHLYDLKMLYLSSPIEALSEMSDYIDEIANDSRYGISYVQKNINIYINWLFECYGDFAAYTAITLAVDYAQDTDSFNEDKSEYGNLSDICYHVHDLKNSKRFYNVYTSFIESITSKEDPLYIKNRIRGFKFLEAEQDWTELEKQVIECCSSLRSLIGKNIQAMSESQREHFVGLLDAPFDYATNLLYEHPTETLASLCFENSIFMKGLLLRSNRETANRIKNSGDKNLLAMYDTLLVLRKELAYREGLGRVGNSLRINSLRKEIDQLDKQLVVSSEAYRQEQEDATANIKSISKVIKQNAVVIDFIQTDAEKLLALILAKDGSVKSVNLGTLKDLLSVLRYDYRQSYSNAGLTNKVWAPIEQNLNDVTEVYYTANGIFNSISFQALSLGGHIHVMDKYNLHLLSNTSNMLLIAQDAKSPISNKSQLAMWGDIDYGSRDNSIIESTSIVRDIVRGETLHHLVYSRDEIDAIQSIVNGKNIFPTIFDGANATELSFRSRAGKNDDIIHISTHGFFDEDDAHRKDYNPMYNSGLFFAGADSTWNKNDTLVVATAMEDDGILRADEIQYLDLSGCHLAVLSACKTGLGHSKNKEGVYGLQRGFKLAGVDKILMSLWNVDDKCTSDFMKEFYLNYYSGLTDEEALRKTQSAIREEYPSPENWGAFVLLY